MRTEQNQNTHPRRPHKLALGEASTAASIQVKKRPKKSKGSRFVGPTQLDNDQKSRIGKALKQKKVGDEMGREIFIGAVEYQISAFAHRLAPRSETEARDPASAPDDVLQTIAEKAYILSGLLRDLSEGARERVARTLSAQDEFGRGYDGRYFSALGGEIDRLAQACATGGGNPTPEKQGPAPDLEPSRAFVAKLAAIFSECFEMEPTADANGPFCTALEVLSEVTGLAIKQEPVFLEQVLAAERPER